ncbi:MAG: hypothetical protein CO093_11270 [Alphaproteobacteria bacterium CG_4_9_14_3_um_filter_47_13]|nr:MAG: hypothetical protein CO093_11270 [Alphaproteobacteria bacterium CG_4_9_14_3_um_filter_47_13]
MFSDSDLWPESKSITEKKATKKAAGIPETDENYSFYNVLYCQKIPAFTGRLFLSGILFC